MQKLRPYIIPGLFLFHLLLLCAMILTSPTTELSRGQLRGLYGSNYLLIMYSQLFLTAVWAGWGPEPLIQRLPGCAAMAALASTANEIWYQRFDTTPYGNLFSAGFFPLGSLFGPSWWGCCSACGWLLF